MSFLIKQPQLPQSAANDLAPVSTYQEGNPISLFFGREMFGSQWQSAPFNWRTAYGGANQPEWQYCSIIAGFAIGPIDFVGKLLRDGKEIANWDYNFPDGVDEHTFTLNPSLALGQAATVVVRRGSETQSPSANVIAGTGQNHPAYRGWVTLEFINIDLGKGNTSLPSFTVELGRHVPAIGAFAGGDSHPYGVNPIAAIYWLLKEAKGGFDIDPAMLNATHWGAQANGLESVGINGRTGNLVHCHPCFKSSKDAGALLSEILAYFDGYLYSDGDELKIGWFPHDAVDVSSLPEITEADLTQKPSGAFSDWTQSPSGAVVMFRDFDRNYQESPAIVPAPANRETGAISTPSPSARPFSHASDQAHMLAAEVSASPTADSGTSLSVKKSRAVKSGGAPLMPGDLMNWDYGPWSLDLACRVIGRRFRMGAAEDVLEIIRERGEFPRPYVASPDARVLPTPVDPGEISTGDVRLFQLPSGFGAVRQVAALINRSMREIIGAKLSFSPSGSAPWEEVLDQRYFAAKCAVSTSSISDTAGAVRLSTSSIDFSRFSAQSTTNRLDDTLLLLIGNELLSVGTITAVSSGIFDLSVLRGRQGSTAAGHSVGEVAWLFYRSELRAAVHNDFYNVRNGSNVYDATVATKHFKIALFSIDEVGLAKPDDPGLSLQLGDLTADGLAGYTILLSREAQTIAADSAGTVASGQLGVSGVARTDISVLRGTTVLSAVSSSPAFGQFAIALGTHSNATATKEDNDTVRCDTLTADTGYIEITVAVDGAFSVSRKFTLTKAKGGATGSTGATGNRVERRYKRSDIVPGTPTGDNPTGWTVAMPSGVSALWVTEGTKTPADVLVGTWSTPVRLSGNITFYTHGHPASALAGYALQDGDNAYNLDDGNKYYRYDGSTWIDAQRVLSLSDFGTGIEPIKVVSSLPSASGYTGPKTVYNAADGKLWRYVSGAWDSSVPAADITAGTFQAGVAYIGALNASQITAGTLAAGIVVASSIGATQIITTSANIANSVITNAHIVSLDAGKITTGSLTAALSITSGGYIEAGSGDYYFRVGGTTMQFGAATFHVYGVGTGLTFTKGSYTTEIAAHTGGAVLSLSGPSSQQTTVAHNGILSNGAIEGYTITAGGGGLSVAGGGNISGGLYVGGSAYFASSFQTAGGILAGGTIYAPNGDFGALTRNDGGWTTPMWDGSNWLQFQWAGGLRVRVDFSSEYDVSIS